MVKFVARPLVTVDEKQNATASLRVSADHGGATYSVTVNDGALRGGDALAGLRLGVRTADGAMEAHFYPTEGHHLLRFQNTLQVRDKDVSVKVTDIAMGDRATYVNCSVAVDDSNTAKVIYKCSPGNRLDHKNAIVGWVYRKDDIELEPRFNLGTESLSAGVTWRADADNKLRAIVDMGSNEGSLSWTNTGGIGGGGDTRVTARMKLDKDSMQQMPTLMISKNWDFDM